MDAKECQNCAMPITRILSLENSGVIKLVDEQFLYVGSNGILRKYNLNDMSLAAHITIHDVKKKSIYSMLPFQIFDDYIFVPYFRDLHVVAKKDLQLLFTVKLGENVSSDVCGVIDFKYPLAYVNIRNGRIDLLDIITKKSTRIEISDSSNWSRCVLGNRIYYSTTKGELLELDRDTLQVLRSVQLTKKMNIYSVVHFNNMLYTTAQRAFRVVDINTFEIVQERHRVFANTEANIIGIHDNALVVAENDKIAVFDAETLQLRERFEFPTGYRHMRYAILSGDTIFGSDHHGIYSTILNEL